MTNTPDDLPLRPIDDDILERPPPEEGGLGEFADTMIDADGQLDPDMLEEKNDGPAEAADPQYPNKS